MKPQVFKFWLAAIGLVSIVGFTLAAEETCDPPCRQGASCVVEDGQATCVCNDICPLIYDPVCGSNGRTYGNTCELDRYNCLYNDNVVAAQDGACGSGEGVRVLNVRAARVCATNCPAVYDPVCGSNGRTYSNECQLGVYNCQNNSNVTVAYPDACGAGL